MGPIHCSADATVVCCSILHRPVAGAVTCRRYLHLRDAVHHVVRRTLCEHGAAIWSRDCRDGSGRNLYGAAMVICASSRAACSRPIRSSAYSRSVSRSRQHPCFPPRSGKRGGKWLSSGTLRNLSRLTAHPACGVYTRVEHSTPACIRYGILPVASILQPEHQQCPARSRPAFAPGLSLRMPCGMNCSRSGADMTVLTARTKHVRTISCSATVPVSWLAWHTEQGCVWEEVPGTATVALRLEVSSRYGPRIVACFLLTVAKQVDDIRLCVVEELVHILV